MLKASKRTGFTLIELLVVIAIIAILAAILFPVFAQAREKARQTACLSNLKQIGSAAIMYSQDWDGVLPMCMWYVTGMSKPMSWVDSIASQLEPGAAWNPWATSAGWTKGSKSMQSLFKCPSALPADTKYNVSMGYNSRLGYSSVSTYVARVLDKQDSNLILIADSINGDTWCRFDDRIPLVRHNNGANLFFADGHVKWTNERWMFTYVAGLTEKYYRPQ